MQIVVLIKRSLLSVVLSEEVSYLGGPEEVSYLGDLWIVSWSTLRGHLCYKFSVRHSRTF